MRDLTGPNTEIAAHLQTLVEEYLLLGGLQTCCEAVRVSEEEAAEAQRLLPVVEARALRLQDEFLQRLLGFYEAAAAASDLPLPAARALAGGRYPSTE